MAKHITIAVDREIFELRPDYRRVVVAAGEGCAAASPPELKQLLREAQGIAKRRFADDNSLVDDRITSWRQAIAGFGAVPSITPPRVEMLVRAALDDTPIPSKNVITDISHIVSLRHVVPCAVHAVDDVRESLVLRRATGRETFVSDSGEPEDPVEPGEVVFADESRVAARRWVGVLGRHTTVTGDTRVAELNIDALHPIDAGELDSTIHEAIDLIDEFCDSPPPFKILTPDDAEVCVCLTRGGEVAMTNSAPDKPGSFMTMKSATAGAFDPGFLLRDDPVVSTRNAIELQGRLFRETRSWLESLDGVSEDECGRLLRHFGGQMGQLLDFITEGVGYTGDFRSGSLDSD